VQTPNKETAVSLSTSERARRASNARWSAKDPDQRKAETRPARLALAIKEIVDQAPALSDDQKNRLRVILTQAPSGGGPDAVA
jgi:hypothetical protein